MEYQAYEISDAAVTFFVVDEGGRAVSQSWMDRFHFVSGAFDTPVDSRWFKPVIQKQSENVTARTQRKIRAVVKAVDAPASSSKDLVREAFVSERLEFIYCNDAASLIDESQSRVALRGVVEAVEDLSDAEDYIALDNLLSNVDVSRLRPITNVAFLRTAFHAKGKLTSWNALYRGVYAHLKNTGQNPDRALRGLSSPRDISFA